MKITASLLRLWAHISRRRRRQVKFLLVLMMISSFAEILSIGAVVPFLGILTAPDSILSNPSAALIMAHLDITQSKQLLLPLTLFFCLAAVLSGGLRLMLLLAQTKVGNAIGADLSMDIYRKTLYQPYEFHIANSSSETISMLSSKVNVIVNQIVLPLLIFASSILLILAIIFTLITIDPIAALSAILGFGLIYVVVGRIAKNFLIENSLKLSQASANVIKILQEGLGGIRDVLIDRTQEAYCLAYQKADLSQRQAGANIQIVAGIPRYAIEALGMILIACLAYFMAQEKGGVADSIPALGALALGAQRLLPLMQASYASWTTIRGGEASLIDALNLLDKKMPESLIGQADSLILFNRSIRFNNISYRYSDAAPWVIRDVSLEIPKGVRVGIIGETGSGKSTLLDIVMGLLMPERGFISIDEVEITDKNKAAWHRLVAHVPQSIFLTDSTIAENIAFGIPFGQIDMAKVRRAAQQAFLDSTIDGFSDGYKTIVGERGVRLSGGQRQRIGIARALYKGADVIILDEATSALDNETESAVMDAINNLSSNITILVVAHRLTTLSKCDVIVEIAGGAISKTGSYNDIVLGN